MHEPARFLDDVEAQAAGEELRDNWCDERAISDAEWSRLALVDRFSRGHLRVVVAGGQRFKGTLTAVFHDAVLLDDSVLLSLHRCEQFEGIETEFPVESIASPLSGRSVLRSWVGTELTLRLTGERTLTGRLLRVGLDHVDLRTETGTAVIPIAAVSAWLLRY